MMNATLNGQSLFPRETQRYFDKRDSANTLAHKIITSDFIPYQVEDFIRRQLGDSRKFCYEEHANDNIYTASEADMLGAIITFLPDNSIPDQGIQSIYHNVATSRKGYEELSRTIKILIDFIFFKLKIALKEKSDIELCITDIEVSKSQLFLDEIDKDNNIISQKYSFKFVFEQSTNKTYINFYDAAGKFIFSSKDEYITGIKTENAR